MPTTKATDTLVTRLIRVAKDVRNIEKFGRNDAQGYAFVQEADVVREVIPKLLAEGILFFPMSRRVVGVIPFETKSGAQSFLTTHETTWVASDGENSISVMTLGQGTDTGDKGVYKGMTGDKKYALLQLLGIATGDDPEQQREDESSTPAQSQLTKLFALGRRVGLEDKAAMQAFVLKRTGKYKSKELTQEEFGALLLEMEAAETAGGTVVL